MQELADHEVTVSQTYVIIALLPCEKSDVIGSHMKISRQPFHILSVNICTSKQCYGSLSFLRVWIRIQPNSEGDPDQDPYFYGTAAAKV